MRFLSTLDEETLPDTKLEIDSKMQSKMHQCLSLFFICLNMVHWLVSTRRITWPYYISKMPIYSRLFCIFPNDISHLVFSVFWWDYWLLLTFSRQLISSVFETLFWLMLTGVMRRLRRRRKMKTGFHTQSSSRHSQQGRKHWKKNSYFDHQPANSRDAARGWY